MTLVGLTLAQYAALLGGASALVVLFYVLKLRRRRVAVPFSKLWERVLMEKQATSLLQKLKRILSLLIQLLLLFLLVTAIANPREEEELRQGRDFVVLLDASASMRARDVDRGDGRIGAARAEVRRMIQSLGPRDRMMLVQMDARVVPLTPMVSDRLVLEAGLAKARATDTRADYPRALRLARDVLTPGRESHVVVVSDGALGPPEDELGEADLGGAALHWVKVGRGGRNVGLTGFSVRRYPIDRSSCEIFAEVANTGDQDEEVELTLLGDGQEQLVRRLSVEKGARARLTLPDQSAASRSLEARVRLVGERCESDEACGEGGRCAADRRCLLADAQPADDRAFALLPERRPVKVLAVSPGNLYLAAALLLDEYLEVTEMTPEEYEGWIRHGAESEGRPYEVVVFDGVAPPPPPTGNVLYLGVEGEEPPLAPGDAATGGIWFDSSRSRREHPILRYVSFGDFEVYQARRTEPGPEDQVIARSEEGLPLVVVRRDDERLVTMTTFALRHSDLPLRMAWPVFLMNTLSWYVEQDTGFISSYPTGEAAHLRVPSDASEARVCGPEGCSEVAVHEGEAVFVPMRVGLYHVRAGDERLEVAVDLSRPEESRMEPAEALTVAGRAADRPPELQAGVGGEIWLWLLMLATLVVVLEWLTYHRRLTV